MRGRLLTAWAVGLAMLAFVSSGCGAAQGAASPPGAVGLDGSPLDDYLGQGSPEARAAATEERVAACMADAGQAYVPGGYVAPGEVPSLADARTYGYGLTTPRPPGPNRVSYEAMSREQRAAWDEAMYGPDGVRGCAAKAQTHEWRTSAVIAADVFQPLRDRLAALDDRIAGDARTRSTMGTWRTCVAEAGYPGLTGPGGGFDEVVRLIGASVGRDFDTEPFDSRYLAELAPIDRERLQRFERSVAVADYTCTQPWEAAVRTVRAEQETAFIGDSRADLDRLRAALHAER
ncbi:hypothetical protein [Actinokineospora sp.]|uniref:hypothetical protein n=1 Tax=Actinokineospora sp. TaxID=1872133 RepID=UPI00403849E0